MPDKLTAQQKQDAAFRLRSFLTSLQVIATFLDELQIEGQHAAEKIADLKGEENFGEKLRTQMLHVTNLIANAKVAMPGFAEIQRRIEKLLAFPPEKITGELGDKVRTHDHGDNVHKQEAKVA